MVYNGKERYSITFDKIDLKYVQRFEDKHCWKKNFKNVKKEIPFYTFALKQI